jgi:hypothetical protein
MTDDVTEQPNCAGTNKDGSPCKRFVSTAGDYCNAHKSQASKEAAPEPEPTPEPEPAPGRFVAREQGANIAIVDTANGDRVHAVTGALDEAKAMARALNENPPEEASATV